MSTLERILLVDDDPDIIAVTTLALEALGGYTVQSCLRGAEALALIPTFAPDLILLDVMMPGLDGPETLAALQTDTTLRPTPAIFMTAKTQHHEIEHYKALGALDVIPKPFDPMCLPTTLQTIWQNNR